MHLRGKAPAEGGFLNRKAQAATASHVSGMAREAAGGLKKDCKKQRDEIQKDSDRRLVYGCTDGMLSNKI